MCKIQIYIKYNTNILHEKKARSMRSANSTWDPRKPIYEELRDAPPVPRRFKDYGAKDCFHPHQPGILVIL